MKIKIRVRRGRGADAGVAEPSSTPERVIVADTSIDSAFTEGF